jgi:hypothetical protein
MRQRVAEIAVLAALTAGAIAIISNVVAHPPIALCAPVGSFPPVPEPFPEPLDAQGTTVCEQ